MWVYILIGGIFLFYLLYYHFSTSGPVLTGQATVVSRRMTVGKGGASRWSDNYNRLITFRFSDGSELELYVNKEAYTVIPDGVTGQLSWRKDNMVEFESDEF